MIDGHIAHQDRFPVEIGNSPEPLPDHQHYLATADLWTVHLRCAARTSNVDAAAGTIVQDFTSLPWRTGHMIGGDSFAEWAEPAKEDDDRALHVYFTAPDRALALARGQHIAGLIGAESPTDYAVSTAADWSVQIPDGFQVPLDTMDTGIDDLPAIDLSPWNDDDTYPSADWKAKVADDDTRLGYREWVAQCRANEDDQ